MDPEQELRSRTLAAIADGLDPVVAVRRAASAMGVSVMSEGTVTTEPELKIDGWSFDAREWARRNLRKD